ncbi:MAG: epoxide hydrolase family protein, partial [Trebonia sp.]
NDVITPYRIDLSEAAIVDLRERLRRVRWPEPATVGGWSQGAPLAWVRELCRYWLEDYDFAAAQERLNQFPQFQTEVDGLDICFKVTGPLADPVAYSGDAADAFHVVCPALPGFGFSGKPAEPGWGLASATAWSTPRQRSPRGSPRSTRRGAITTATPSACSPRRRCSTTSCCTGCPPPGRQRPGSTGKPPGSSPWTP